VRGRWEWLLQCLLEGEIGLGREGRIIAVGWGGKQKDEGEESETLLSLFSKKIFLTEERKGII